MKYLPNTVVDDDWERTHTNTQIDTCSIDWLRNASFFRHCEVTQETNRQRNVRSHKDGKEDSGEEELSESLTQWLHECACCPYDAATQPYPLARVDIGQRAKEQICKAIGKGVHWTNNDGDLDVIEAQVGLEIVLLLVRVLLYQ